MPFCMSTDDQRSEKISPTRKPVFKPNRIRSCMNGAAFWISLSSSSGLTTLAPVLNSLKNFTLRTGFTAKKKSQLIGGQMGGQRNTTSYNNERDVVPLVMDSEITGLENLHGYLKSGNLVVRMSFPFVELPIMHQRFIQRPTEIRPEEPPKTAATAAGARGGPEQKLTQQEIKQDREQELKQSRAWQGHFFR